MYKVKNIHHLEQNIRVNVDSLFKFNNGDCKFQKLRFTLLQGHLTGSFEFCVT